MVALTTPTSSLCHHKLFQSGCYISSIWALGSTQQNLICDPMTMSEPGPQFIAGGAFTIKPDDHRPNHNKNVKGLPPKKKQRVDGRNLAKQQLLFLCMYGEVFVTRVPTYEHST